MNRRRHTDAVVQIEQIGRILKKQRHFQKQGRSRERVGFEGSRSSFGRAAHQKGDHQQERAKVCSLQESGKGAGEEVRAARGQTVKEEHPLEAKKGGCEEDRGNSETEGPQGAREGSRQEGGREAGSDEKVHAA